MGDWFQSIIDPKATEADAPLLAQALLRWLVDEEIVVAEKSDCTYGDGGHAPGPCYTKAIGTPSDRIHGLRTNGVEVVCIRTVFHNGGLGFKIVCDACGGRFDPPQGLWGDAVGEWYDRSGPGLLACPQCNATRPITEWRHDPNFGFANLGFTFWNWPKLADEFVDAFGERIGHGAVVVVGKL